MAISGLVWNIGEILFYHWIIFHVSGVYTSGDMRPIPACWQLSVYLGGRLLCGFLWRYSQDTYFHIYNAYEQIHIEPECVKHSGFSTPYGTFESNVMQQGDCNALSTFQWVLTWVFHDRIGLDMHVWFNDIFIGMDSIQEHNN